MYGSMLIYSQRLMIMGAPFNNTLWHVITHCNTPTAKHEQVVATIIGIMPRHIPSMPEFSQGMLVLLLVGFNILL